MDVGPISLSASSGNHSASMARSDEDWDESIIVLEWLRNLPWTAFVGGLLVGSALSVNLADERAPG